MDISILTSEISNDSGVSGTTAKDALDALATSISGATAASGIANDSSVAGATVKAALDELASHIGSGGAVSSVFGRNGAVMAQSGDYSAAQVGAPPLARALATGAGLTGGGDLSADRTLAVDFGPGAGQVCAGNDPRLSDLRIPTSHALSHLPGGSDALVSGPPTAVVVGGSNAEGTAAAFARQDHVHALPAFGATAGHFCEGDDSRLSDARTPTSHAGSHLPGGADALLSGPPSAIVVGGANTEGAAAAFARQDHVHALPSFGSTAGHFCEGDDARLSDARTPTSHAASHLPGGADALLSGPPSAVVVGGSNSEGTAGAFARQDHVHALPSFGATAGAFCEGNDSRLSDARSPTMHALNHLPNSADGLATAAPIAVGIANSAGTANSYARSDHAHDASALLPRDGSRALTGTLDAGGNNLVNVGAVFESPTSFGWSSNAATIDVSVKNDFVASAVMTGNSNITLANGVDGCQGTIYVKQDATGGRTLAFVVAGRTILREAGAVDSNPQPAAQKVTGYCYDFKTIGGTAYVIVERFYLS